MIFDGPEKFKDSTVKYTRFRHYPLRERFAKLREQEAILQKTIEATKKKFPDEYFKTLKFIYNPDIFEWIKTHFNLQFVEGELMWMAHNVADEFRDDETALGYSRSRSRKGKNEPKESKQISLFGLMGIEGFEEDDNE